MHSFWDKVDKSGECWEWIGNKLESGYGRIGYKRKRILAHRFAWELVNGQIPNSLLVCHSCDNPGCVKPNHLFIGTQTDNMRDMMKKNRHARCLVNT